MDHLNAAADPTLERSSARIHRENKISIANRIAEEFRLRRLDSSAPHPVVIISNEVIAIKKLITSILLEFYVIPGKLVKKTMTNTKPNQSDYKKNG